MKLSIKQIQQILTNHGLSTHLEDGIVMVKEEYINTFGNYNYNWIESPTTTQTIKQWLGY
jgi:hypothetical protein